MLGGARKVKMDGPMGEDGWREKGDGWREKGDGWREKGDG